MDQTLYLDQLITQCDDLDDFRREIFPIVQDASVRWKEKMEQILTETGLTKTRMAQLCGVSRPAVAKWLAGSLPSSREDYIRIGFAAGYGLDEMNFFLQRYGRYPGLYAKSLEDSVVIFLLNSDSLEKSYAVYEQILAEIRVSIDTPAQETRSMLDTNLVYDGLIRLSSVDALQDFVQRNAAAYRGAYEKFYAYVNAFITANNSDVVSRQVYSVSALADAQNWSSSLRQCVSAIRQRKWFPLRRKVIVLGLHLNMNVDQINEMLALAKMEPLCAKNPVESAIIFAVNDAELNDLICQDGGMELCEYVKRVISELDLEGADAMLRDL